MIVAGQQIHSLLRYLRIIPNLSESSKLSLAIVTSLRSVRYVKLSYVILRLIIKLSVKIVLSVVILDAPASMEPSVMTVPFSNLVLIKSANGENIITASLVVIYSCLFVTTSLISVMQVAGKLPFEPSTSIATNSSTHVTGLLIISTKFPSQITVLVPYSTYRYLT